MTEQKIHVQLYKLDGQLVGISLAVLFETLPK